MARAVLGILASMAPEIVEIVSKDGGACARRRRLCFPPQLPRLGKDLSLGFARARASAAEAASGELHCCVLPLRDGEGHQARLSSKILAACHRDAANRTRLNLGALCRKPTRRL